MAARTQLPRTALPMRRGTSLVSSLLCAVCFGTLFEPLLDFVFPQSRALRRSSLAGTSSSAAARLRGPHVVTARGGDTDRDEAAPDDYVFEPAQVIGALNVGQELQGVVTKVMPFGAFVDIGGDKDGLVPISKLQDTRTENVEDVVQVGQGVTVWVSSMDKDKLTLSMSRNKIFNPGMSTASLGRFTVNESVWLDGMVVKVVNFGAFVAVKPLGEQVETAQGLVHISQLQDGPVEYVEDVVKIGQPVKVRVLSVDVESRKLALSMKSPSRGGAAAFENVDPTEWLTGKVVSMRSFGAFVRVQPPGDGGAPVDGLVHITQIKDGFVEDPQEELELEQEVKVRVLLAKDGRLSLSMKEPASSTSD